MSVETLYMNKAFGFTAIAISALMTGQGIIIIVNQAWAMKKFWLARFNEINLILISSFFLIIGSVGMAIPNFYIFIIATLIGSFMHPIFRAVMTSETINLASISDRGEVLGIMASVMSLGMIIGPAIAEPVFSKAINGPYIVGSLIFLIGFVVLFYKRKNLLEHSEPVKENVNVV
jgi:predicted MFS family arabinose efflux permease